MKAKQEKTSNIFLRDRVQEQLEWDPQVTSTEIGVAAEDGVVTLTGTVRSYAERMAAERVAQKTFGVRAVANDLVVHPFMKVVDADIAINALKALDNRVDIPKERIKVIVNDGCIDLRGSVDWKFQKDAAGKAVAHLFGAKAVYNNIKVEPKVSNIDVRTKIEAAFRRNADIDARRITVTSHDSTVELWGDVHSWTELSEAEKAAWAAPGVGSVKNHLHIVP